jgi:hypothetical protein
MELRSHPGMTYRGIPNWPPSWTQSRRDMPPKIARGEVGRLKYVFANENISTKCFLVIEHDGESYVGALIFNDQALCKQITRILRAHVGRSIQEIGGLDLSHTM